MLSRKMLNAALILSICGLLFSQPVLAAVPVAGWGYSFGNWLSGQSDDPTNPWVITEGWGWVLDPALDNPIISGRVTLKFDPSWTVGGYGWLGEFGADQSMQAPPIGAIRFDSSLLQMNANPAMQSSNISIDQNNGLAVFEFDWGTAGFVPTTALNNSGHFNFAAILFTDPLVLPDADMVTSVGAGVIAPYGIVGTPEETGLLGIDSSTYMLCESGYCGVIPEPSTFVLVTLGVLPLVFTGIAKRKKQLTQDSSKP
jgi:hypothetical protein